MLSQDKTIKTFWKLFQFTPIKLAESSKSQSTKNLYKWTQLSLFFFFFFDDQGEKGGEYCGKVH